MRSPTEALVAGIDGPTVSGDVRVSCLHEWWKTRFPARFWSQGRQIHLTAYGRVTWLAEDNRGLVFVLSMTQDRIGEVDLIQFPAAALANTGGTDGAFMLEADIICRSNGDENGRDVAEIKFLCFGRYTSVTTTWFFAGPLLLPITGPAVGESATIEWAAPSKLDLVLLQDQAPGSSLTLMHYRVDDLG